MSKCSVYVAVLPFINGKNKTYKREETCPDVLSREGKSGQPGRLWSSVSGAVQMS